MAYASNLFARRTAPAFGVAELLGALRGSMAQRRIYRKTVAELNSLSDRTLNDLGIHRTQIRLIAKNTVYGFQP